MGDQYSELPRRCRLTATDFLDMVALAPTDNVCVCVDVFP
jgi:hypothetical protein